MKRLAVLIAFTALLLSGCAATGPAQERDAYYAYVCFPGSAVRRRAPEGAYPAWMYLDKGTCKHR